MQHSIQSPNMREFYSKCYRTNSHMGQCITSYWMRPKHFHLPFPNAVAFHSIHFTNVSDQCSNHKQRSATNDFRPSNCFDNDTVTPMPSIKCSLCNSTGTTKRRRNEVIDANDHNEFSAIRETSDSDELSDSSSVTSVAQSIYLSARRIVIKVFRANQQPTK